MIRSDLRIAFSLALHVTFDSSSLAKIRVLRTSPAWSLLP